MLSIDQTVGQDPYPQTAQVFPLASLMNPVSPQLPPQEFLMRQQSLVTPTRRTPWLMAVPQLLRTPVLQRDQLEASTATETGLWFKALRRLSHPGTSTQPVILLGPPFLAQAWSLATQGQEAWSVMPLAWTQSKAESIHPPLQPMFPQDREQSTNCCSDRLMLVPAIIQALSMDPVAEKAQQDPQAPWFLTAETFPWLTQSTSPTKGVVVCSLMISTVFLGGARVRQRALNSASVRSANWLTPSWWVLAGLALCSAILTRFLRKMVFLQASSPSLRQDFLQSFLNCSKEQASEVGWRWKRAKAAKTASTATRMCDLFMNNYKSYLKVFDLNGIGSIVQKLQLGHSRSFHAIALLLSSYSTRLLFKKTINSSIVQLFLFCRRDFRSIDSTKYCSQGLRPRNFHTSYAQNKYYLTANVSYEIDYQIVAKILNMPSILAYTVQHPRLEYSKGVLQNLLQNLYGMRLVFYGMVSIGLSMSITCVFCRRAS